MKFPCSDEELPDQTDNLLHVGAGGLRMEHGVVVFYFSFFFVFFFGATRVINIHTSKSHAAMGQNPNRTPSEHPNPTTEIGSKMGSEFTYQPKWDPIGTENALKVSFTRTRGSHPETTNPNQPGVI